MAVKAAFRTLLTHLPLALWRTLAPKDVYAFVYHVVADEDLPHVQHYAYKSAAQFDADLAWLARRGGFLPYAELEAVREGDGGAGAGWRGAAMITFDDGFVECFEVARPILLRRRAPAVFFITTDFIADRANYYESRIALAVGAVSELSAEAAEQLWRRLGKTARELPGFDLRETREPGTGRLARGRIPTPPTPRHRDLLRWLLNLAQQHEPLVDHVCEALAVDIDAYLRERRIFMNEDELRTLHAEGFTLGAHGTRHRKLQTMSPAELEAEIVTACDAVRAVTGQARVPFAFPHSGRGLDRALLAEVRRKHPFVGLYFDTGGLRSEIPSLVHRLGADTPRGAESGTNLPRLLREAYSRRPAWRRMPSEGAP